jgi:hypothetical protein
MQFLMHSLVKVPKVWPNILVKKLIYMTPNKYTTKIYLMTNLTILIWYHKYWVLDNMWFSTKRETAFCKKVAISKFVIHVSRPVSTSAGKKNPKHTSFISNQRHHEPNKQFSHPPRKQHWGGHSIEHLMGTHRVSRGGALNSDVEELLAASA